MMANSNNAYLCVRSDTASLATSKIIIENSPHELGGRTVLLYICVFALKYFCTK